MLVLAEEAAEAAGGDARGRRVQRRLHVAGRPVPAVAAPLLPRILGPGRPGELARRRLVLVLPHRPRRPGPPVRLARPLQPGHVCIRARGAGPHQARPRSLL